MYNIRHILLLLIVCVGCVWAESCHSYIPNGICSNYISSDTKVYLSGNEDIGDVEARLSPLTPLLGAKNPLLLLPNIPPDASQACTIAFTKWACSIAYPKCPENSKTDFNTTLYTPCQSLCTDVASACANLTSFLGILDSHLPELAKELFNASYYQVPNPSDCDGNISNAKTRQYISPVNDMYKKPYATDQCYSLKVSDKPLPVCPDPLIVDPRLISARAPTVSPYCQNGCCVPCPQSYSLYKKDYLGDGFFVTQIVRALSAIASLITLLSYSILPGKQAHPSVLILFTSLAIFLYSSNVFFSLGDPKRIQCTDEVTPSDQGNNYLCGFQGSLLIFASHATTIWLAAIILNLHIHTVWNSNFLADKYVYIHSICWGVPAILTIIPLITQTIKYQFATLCLIDQEYASFYFFYPMACFVLPSFFVHCATFFHIAKISAQADTEKTESSFAEFMTHKNHVIQAVRIQWRALLLAVITLATVMLYWLFYFIELKRVANLSENPAVLNDWEICIGFGKGQNYCARYSKPYVPPYGLLMFTELSASLIGVELLVIFSNRSLWTEWRVWFGDLFRARRKLEIPDQFFAI